VKRAKFVAAARREFLAEVVYYNKEEPGLGAPTRPHQHRVQSPRNRGESGVGVLKTSAIGTARSHYDVKVEHGHDTFTHRFAARFGWPRLSWTAVIRSIGQA
jgi:hypothetical protein